MATTPPYSPVRLYPCNPNTERGVSIKLSVSKDKLIYANGKTVVIRDLKNPALTSVYSGHVRNVSVARFSPTGYYCASADVQGTVRIWDTIGEENILKGEYKTISGKINDLAWDSESKRIIAVGDGRGKFGHAFIFDTGNSVGEISGHSKSINAVSIRHQRPFRAATASDDGQIVFHQGVPFKYDRTIKTHTKFVHDVRFASSGEFFASAGSDIKIFVYDGKTGDTLGEFTEGGHQGSVMSCSWSTDNKLLATSSLDCTVKLWDVETRKAIQTWSLGTGIPNQQVGSVWSSEGEIVSLSMSGDLNIFDQRVGDKPSRILKGPQKAITAGSLTSSGTFLTGSADGRIMSFSETSEADSLDGEGHSNLVVDITSSKDLTYSVGFDDRLREISPDGKAFTQAMATLSSQPKSTAVGPDGSVFVAEIAQIEVFRSNQKISELSVEYGPSSVAVGNQTVAVGGEDKKIYLYSWTGDALKELGTLEENRGTITAISFSPDGSLLAAGDSTGKIVLYNVQDQKASSNMLHIESRWTNHSARVLSLSWTADGAHIASGSLDTHVYIWSVSRPLSPIAIRNAGPGGVNFVVWLSSDGAKGRVASAGADACVRTWDVVFKD
ncbi:WD40 repeat-like protein [Rickenella mellea]|uniref:WD40 repeat-like protein n=1 Tax=Rickenella mellea TaxID=50990 RepID=A0A4Y7QE26_9AGAM|nr:WD40 repeat-like protein [Rickenella mellea]